jgi:hypothetical protein
VELCLAAPARSLRLAADSGFEAARTVTTIGASLPDDLITTVRSSDLVVSITNPEAAQMAARGRVPCLYVDVLLWMWTGPQVPRAAALRYFAEDFPGVKENALRWHAHLPPVHVIPPLVAGGHRSVATDDNVLLSFGGLASWMIPPRQLLAYAQAMTECVAEAMADWPGPITVAVGPHVLAPLRASARLARTNVHFSSLDHLEYLRTLDRSRLLVTSPGHHALCEAFARGVPCLLLPSQNLSQALALRAFRDLDLADVLDWEDIYGLNDLTAAAERESCARIADCFDRFLNDPPARARLVAHLRELLPDARLEAAVHAQDAFFAAFGGRDGGQRVAAAIREVID